MYRHIVCPKILSFRLFCAPNTYIPVLLENPKCRVAAKARAMARNKEEADKKKGKGKTRTRGARNKTNQDKGLKKSNSAARAPTDEDVGEARAEF